MSIEEEPVDLKAADEDSEFDLAKLKKKKKKDKKDKVVVEEKPEEDVAAAAVTDDVEDKVDDSEKKEADSEFDLSKLKKKKKKKTPKTEEELKDEVDDDAGGDRPAWAASDRDYDYTELLDRVFTLLREKNPNLAVRKRHVMPPPQLVRVGTRKTMWANFAQMAGIMHRSPEHVFSFVMSELATEGSIDANLRLLIKGRYVQKQIESLLKKYIVEYVTCHMCRNPETTLTRDAVTRLYFLQCESCASIRSVAPIKAGFHATSRADRRAART